VKFEVQADGTETAFDELEDYETGDTETFLRSPLAGQAEW
jgi:hypothetical protein